MPDSFVKFEKVDKSYDGEVLVVKDLNLDYDNIDHESKIEDIETELESASQALEYTILDLTKNRS